MYGKYIAGSALQPDGLGINFDEQFGEITFTRQEWRQAVLYASSFCP